MSTGGIAAAGEWSGIMSQVFISISQFATWSGRLPARPNPRDVHAGGANLVYAGGPRRAPARLAQSGQASGRAAGVARGRQPEARALLLVVRLGLRRPLDTGRGRPDISRVHRREDQAATPPKPCRLSSPDPLITTWRSRNNLVDNSAGEAHSFRGGRNRSSYRGTDDAIQHPSTP